MSAMNKAQYKAWCVELANKINNDPALLTAFRKMFASDKSIEMSKENETLVQQESQAER